MDCSRPSTKDPDEWLENAPAFSKPICADLREWIFREAPDLTESIKWNVLCFSGRKLVCGLSACRKHVGFTFFRGTELPDPSRLFSGGETNTNIRSVRITNLDGLKRVPLAALLRVAVVLDDSPEIPPSPKVKREPWPMPDFFTEALQNDHAARAGFESFAPTYQKEYIVWLTTARRPETRQQRLQQTLAALAARRKWAERKLA